MAAPRLPFLYPNLFRSVRSCEPTTYRSIRFPPSASNGSCQGFHSGRKHETDTPHQRYGPAAEPRLPPPGRPKEAPIPPPPAGKEAKSREKKDGDKQGTESRGSQDSKKETKSASSPPGPASNPEADSRAAADSAKLGSEETVNSAAQNQAGKQGPDTSQDPLPNVFQLPDDKAPVPSAGALSGIPVSTENQKPPHLSPPPYVHHFDTYTLVKDLERGGFTEKQSVSIMKAIRGLLADNLEVAREGLVSKSDVENETYLFRAASSELRNSVSASRNSEIQSQRSRRAQLQHEFDILSQRMTQELMALKDDLKGMFDDQKISTRELQRSLDTAIQELNYQITVSLNSDGKSEVEGLRWILTRRAALAIATSAGMIIMALRYQSYKNHEKEAAAATNPPEPKPAPVENVGGNGPEPSNEKLLPEASFTEPLG